MKKVRILFVCTGNICRSPMAQAVGQLLARRSNPSFRYEFDSAGTHAMRGGALTDKRARAALERGSYEPIVRRARALLARDFSRSDLVIAMDHANLRELQRVCPSENSHKLKLLLDFAPGFEGQEVPDPYYGSPQGFDRVLELCEAGVRGLLMSDLSGEAQIDAGRIT